MVRSALKEVFSLMSCVVWRRRRQNSDVLVREETQSYDYVVKLQTGLTTTVLNRHLSLSFTYNNNNNDHACSLQGLSSACVTDQCVVFFFTCSGTSSCPFTSPSGSGTVSS